MKKRIWVAFAMMSALSLWNARAELYVYDGVPVEGGSAAGAYNATVQNTSSITKLYKQSPTAMTGFSGAWGGSDTSTISVNSNGLHYAAHIPLETQDGAFQIFHNETKTDASCVRSVYRTVTAIPAAFDVLYISMLLGFGNDSAFTSFQNGQWCGAGFTTDLLSNYSAYPPSTGVYFGFHRENGTVRLMARVLSTNYTLLENPVAGESYLCVARIVRNADGTETVSFCVNPPNLSEDFSGVAPVTTDVLGDAETFGYFFVGGRYSVRSQSILFDEVRVGNSYKDVVGEVAGMPDFAGPVSVSVDGSTAISLEVGLSDASGDAVVDFFWGTTNAAMNAEAWENSALTDSATRAGETATHRAAVAPNTSYYYAARATNAVATAWAMATPPGFYTGELAIERVSDAEEFRFVPGYARISRGESAPDDAAPLVVNYVVSGDAVVGSHYEALPGFVTIPAGTNCVDVAIVPLMNATDESDRAVTLTLAPGAYVFGETKSATVDILSITLPTDTNIWIGAGSASEPSNWSLGRVPVAEDNILLDPLYSNEDMTWNAADGSGLSDTVASWTQTADYAGTVTISTVRGGAFDMLTITGDAVLEGGNWRHVLIHDQDRRALRVTVNGDLTTGAGFSFYGIGYGYGNGRGPSTSGSGNTTNPIAHGGEAGGRGSSCVVYGDYRMPLWGGSTSTAVGGSLGGGGVFYICVDGTFRHDGIVTAKGAPTGSYPAHSGGSIYIQAGSLTGNGEINAEAGLANGTNKRIGGGGGRIAIHLTAPEATFASFTNAFAGSISAAGSYGQRFSASENHYPGSCGTVYVETPADAGRGVMLLDNKDISNPVKFPNDVPWPSAVISGSVYSERIKLTIPSINVWDLATLELRGGGRVGIPTGSQLVLPASDAIVSDGHALNALRLDGGTVRFTGEDKTLTLDGFDLIANGENAYTDGELRIAQDATLTVSRGNFTAYRLYVDNRPVPAGVYTAEQLNDYTAPFDVMIGDTYNAGTTEEPDMRDSTLTVLQDPPYTLIILR